MDSGSFGKRRFGKNMAADVSATKYAETSQAKNICRNFSSDMLGITGVCMLALTVAKTSSLYDRFAISVPARSSLLFDLALQDGNISSPEGPRGTRGNGDISEARFMLSIIPTLIVLSFFFNSWILQTGILQTGPNQFVENQKQNLENTGPRSYRTFRHEKFAETSRVFLLPKRLWRNVLFPFRYKVTQSLQNAVSHRKTHQ